MRWLYRRFGVQLVSQMPEIVALVGAAELARYFDGFRLDSMVAEMPDKAYAVGAV